MLKVKPLEWTDEPPVGQEGDPGSQYATGVGGDYCLHQDGTLFWVDDPFTWAKFATEASAKRAAQEDHRGRVLALIETTA